jgi:hypothetical protein
MSQVTVFEGVWRKMVSRAGSVSELARELQTTRRTLYAWATGERRPQALIMASVDAWAERQGLKSPWTSKAKTRE